MFNLILYILTIKYISAVPLGFRDHQLPIVTDDVEVGEDCSWLTIIYTTPEHNIQIPEKCEGYAIDSNVDAECDSHQFPKKCTFGLKQVQNSSAFLQNLLSVKDTARNPSIPKPNQDDDESMTKWATVAMGKAMIFGEEGSICKPDSVWRAHRTLECDTCWNWWVPYPCNCNCRGWDQYGVVCRQPCWHHGDHTHDDGLFRCFKPCDREGQMFARVGCGAGFDRVCVAGSWDCGWQWTKRVWNAATVVANVVPGLGTALNKAAKAVSASLNGLSAVSEAAKRIGKVSGAIFQLRTQLRDVAKELKDKYKDAEEMKKAFSHMSENRKECIMEEAALRFLTANMPAVEGTDYPSVIEMVDPTGLVSLARDWVPSSDHCDNVAFCTVDHCPGFNTDTRQPQGSPVISPTSGYQYVGNGFCLNADGTRLDFNWEDTDDVQQDGSAKHCEEKCNNDADCVGYMSEDGKKCSIVFKSSHSCNSGTTMYVDGETRNHCWKKTG